MTTRPDTAMPSGSGISDPEPALSVGAVARRLGVAPATLRTWDRRYGVGPSGHTTGHHRRYRSLDIARLELMQRALLRGASPAEAARYALGAGSQAAEPALTAEGAVEPPGDRPAAVIGSPRGGPGGRVLRLPGASRAARGLGRAVLAMDSAAAARLLAEAIAAGGVIGAWTEVIRPVLGATAQRWEHSGVGAEFERLLSECVLAALVRATEVVDRPRNPRPVLLACVPGERQTLPLRALVAELSRRALGTRMFGAGLPTEAFAAAIRRTAPAVVVLWAATRGYADPGLIERLPRTRPRARLFLAGAGWPPAAGTGQLTVDPLDGLGPAADDIERVVLGRSD